MKNYKSLKHLLIFRLYVLVLLHVRDPFMAIQNACNERNCYYLPNVFSGKGYLANVI